MLLFHSRVLFPFCFALQWDGGIGEDWMPAPPLSPPPPPFPNPVSGEQCGQVTSDKVTKHISRQKSTLSQQTFSMSLVGKQRKQAQLRSNCAVWWKVWGFMWAHLIALWTAETEMDKFRIGWDYCLVP